MINRDSWAPLSEVNGGLRQYKVCDSLRCSGLHARYTDDLPDEADSGRYSSVGATLKQTL